MNKGTQPVRHVNWHSALTDFSISSRALAFAWTVRDLIGEDRQQRRIDRRTVEVYSGIDHRAWPLDEVQNRWLLAHEAGRSGRADGPVQVSRWSMVLPGQSHFTPTVSVNSSGSVPNSAASVDISSPVGGGEVGLSPFERRRWLQALQPGNDLWSEAGRYAADWWRATALLGPVDCEISAKVLQTLTPLSRSAAFRAMDAIAGTGLVVAGRFYGSHLLGNGLWTIDIGSSRVRQRATQADAEVLAWRPRNTEPVTKVVGW